MDFLHKVNTNGWIALSLVGCCGILLLVLATTKFYKHQRYKRTNSITSLSPFSQSILVHHLLAMPTSSDHHLSHSYESIDAQRQNPYIGTFTACTPKVTSFMSCMLPQSKVDGEQNDEVSTPGSSPGILKDEMTSTSTPKHHMITCLPSAIKATSPWTSTNGSNALWGLIGKEAIVFNNKMSGCRREKHLLIYPQIPAARLPRVSILEKRNSTNFKSKGCQCKDTFKPMNKIVFHQTTNDFGHNDNLFITNSSNVKGINNPYVVTERIKCKPGNNMIDYNVASPNNPSNRDDTNENLAGTLREINDTLKDEREGTIQNEDYTCDINNSTVKGYTHSNGIIHFSLEYHKKTKAFVINVSKITGLTTKGFKEVLGSKEHAKNAIKSESLSLTDSGLGVWERNSFFNTLLECDPSIENPCEIKGQPDNHKLVQVYVEIELLPERKQVLQTRQLSKNISDITSKPLVFEEEFTIYGDLSVDQLMDTALLMRVLIMNSPREYKEREMIVGQAYLPLNDIAKEFVDKMVMVCQELDPLLMIDTLGSPTMSLQSKEHEKYRGDLYLCLSLLPEKASLEVVILKAKNLRSPCTTLIDPYVKICFKNQHAICMGKQKTKVRRRTNNPVFNETFTFAIPSSFDIKHVLQSELAHSTFDITVRDWAQESFKQDSNPSRKPKYRVIGRCKLEPAVRGDFERNTTLFIQDHHIKDVLENPNKRVPRWHRLWI